MDPNTLAGVTYRHRAPCGQPIHVEVHPGYERNEWKLVCACGAHLDPDGYELEAITVQLSVVRAGSP